MQEAGVTLNSEKCRFAQKSVKFLGHCIDGTGIRPDPEKVMAIQKVRVPTNVGNAQRFLGMVNQMGKVSPNLAESTQPLRELWEPVGVGRITVKGLYHNQRSSHQQPSPCSI